MPEEELIVQLNDFLTAGVHIGMKYRTRYMEKHIFKIRSDGLSVLNIQEINNRVKLLAKFLAKYNLKKILVVCRRDCGISSIKKFAELTGAMSFPGRYLPGSMTNPSFSGYIEPELLFTVDPWADKNAVNDALKIGIPIVALCDTNNTTNNVDLIVPCNNKGKKSLAFIFWVLTKELLKESGKIKDDSEYNVKPEDFE